MRFRRDCGNTELFRRSPKSLDAPRIPFRKKSESTAITRSGTGNLTCIPSLTDVNIGIPAEGGMYVIRGRDISAGFPVGNACGATSCVQTLWMPPARSKRRLRMCATTVRSLPDACLISICTMRIARTESIWKSCTNHGGAWI